jgi:hypothetical protein
LNANVRVGKPKQAQAQAQAQTTTHGSVGRWYKEPPSADPGSGTQAGGSHRWGQSWLSPGPQYTGEPAGPQLIVQFPWARPLRRSQLRDRSRWFLGNTVKSATCTTNLGHHDQWRTTGHTGPVHCPLRQSGLSGFVRQCGQNDSLLLGRVISFQPALISAVVESGTSVRGGAVDRPGPVRWCHPRTACIVLAISDVAWGFSLSE